MQSRDSPTQIRLIDFWQMYKAIQWRKGSFFNRVENIHMQKSKLNLKLVFYTKSNSKWITDLNVKHKTKMFRRKPRRQSLWLGVRWGVLRHDSKSSMIHKTKNNNKLDLSKLKTFALHILLTKWKAKVKILKIHAKHISNPGLLSKVHKEISN